MQYNELVSTHTALDAHLFDQRIVLRLHVLGIVIARATLAIRGRHGNGY